jgi:hypothetical protein
MDQIIRRMSSSLSRCKRKKSVDNYFAFGSHQRLCQENWSPPWTCTFAVVKDQVLGCLTRIFLAWHKTLSYMESFNNPSEDLTTMWFDTKRLTKLHFPSQHQWLDNTATLPPTAIKFLLKWESRRMKTSTTMANHDPRMNRTDPKYRAFRHRWYSKYLVWFLQLFVDCLVCSGYCLQLLCVFLSVYCYLVHVLVFGLPALKTLWFVKPN